MKIIDTSDTYVQSDTSSVQSHINSNTIILQDPLQLNSIQITGTSSNSFNDELPLLIIPDVQEQDIPNYNQQDINHKPLLDKSKIGSKRRSNIKASIEIEKVVSN